MGLCFLESFPLAVDKAKQLLLQKLVSTVMNEDETF